MKERPILFSGAMVRAILEGQKTVTRRAIKHQPDVPVTDAIPRRNYPHGPATVDWYWRPQHGHLNGVPSHGWDFKCPYGQPGDRLWVRETLEVVAALGVYYAASGPNPPGGYLDDRDVRGVKLLARYGDHHDTNLARQIPCIHMPRWASRILLEITDVRVERLQDISEQQARAEGVHRDVRKWFKSDEGGFAHNSATDAFADLWCTINGAESWNANPWVWVVEFKRVMP